MARVLVGMGITKIRLTGGEPLLRNGVVEFVRELAKLRAQGLKPSSSAGANGTAKAVPFPTPSLDIALTTNGHLLADLAQPLKDAGLYRVTVSMDAVDPDRFARITRVPNGYDHVLAGIRAARRAGLGPVKVNCVLMRGFNEDQIIPFGMFAREEDVVVRFIEFMPLEEGRTWAPSTVVPLDEILARMSEYRAADSRFRTRARRRRGATVSKMASGNRHHCSRVASLSADIAAGFASPATARFAPACFRCGITTCMRRWSAERATRNWRNLSAEWCQEGRTPSHRRTGFCARFADDGAHRRVVVAHSLLRHAGGAASNVSTIRSGREQTVSCCFSSSSLVGDCPGQHTSYLSWSSDRNTYPGDSNLKSSAADFFLYRVLAQ